MIIVFKKFTNLVQLCLLTIVCQSCSKITCEAYDLSHSSMEWHLFPTTALEYEFYSSTSLEVKLVQNSYNIDEKEVRWCHLCACMNSSFDVSYEDSIENIQIDCSVSSSAPDDIHPGIFIYSVNDTYVQLRLSESNEFIPESIYPPEKTSFSTLDSIDLDGQMFYDVVQLDILESNKIEKIWIARGIGLIGFLYNGNEMIKK
jgi:hypothetical protein